MKKLILSGAFLLSFILFSCSPYKNLTDMEFEEIPYPFEVKKVSLSDTMTIAYADLGTGKQTIIFIHGLGSYLPAWKKNLPELSKNYRCIAIDLPGYGKSSKKPHSGMMDFYADVLIKFMDKLKLKSAIIAGHSMGGQIAMVAALKYTNRIDKLILVSPAGFETYSPGEKQWFRDAMTTASVKNTSARQIRINLVNNFYNMPADAEFMVTDRLAMRNAKDFDNYCYNVARSVHGMVDQPVYDLLDKIKQPTLIVFGEKDNLIPNPYLTGGKTVDIAMIGKEKIPDSKLVMIPDAGHFVMFEKSEIFNQSVVDFLK